MSRSFYRIFIFALLVFVGACSRDSSRKRIIVEVPSGFSGNFVLEMGVTGAPPLAKRGDAYVVTVPRTGKVVTSTLLTKSQPTFQNASEGAVWGYSHSVANTGDGIPVGGRIEFFVGTRKEYEAEQGKKKHSGAVTSPVELVAMSA